MLLAVAVPLFAEEPTQLDVLLLEEIFHPELLRFTATLAPLREAELAFEVPGEVNTRCAELGQRVEPGQELLTLYPPVQNSKAAQERRITRRTKPV